jgi:hypothetical protein
LSRQSHYHYQPYLPEIQFGTWEYMLFIGASLVPLARLF